MIGRRLRGCVPMPILGGSTQPISLLIVSSTQIFVRNCLKTSFHVGEIHPIYIRKCLGSKPPNPTSVYGDWPYDAGGGPRVSVCVL
eukprot:768172-Heterocapsa_arctica.AAC.1